MKSNDEGDPIAAAAITVFSVLSATVGFILGFGLSAQVNDSLIHNFACGIIAGGFVGFVATCLYLIVLSRKGDETSSQ